MKSRLTNFLTSYGRKPPLVLLVFGVMGMAVNYWTSTTTQKYYLITGVASPIFFVVGLVGVIDPRFYWLGAMYNRKVPQWCRKIGCVVALIGLALAVFLNVYFYKTYWHF